MNRRAIDGVLNRSGGRCEAMVRVGEVWTRCGKGRVQIHHMIKRARGGEILDDWIIEHLIAVCQQHHMFAEESGEDTGLLMDGYVGRDVNGLPTYNGSEQLIHEALEVFR